MERTTGRSTRVRIPVTFPDGTPAPMVPSTPSAQVPLQQPQFDAPSSPDSTPQPTTTRRARRKRPAVTTQQPLPPRGRPPRNPAQSTDNSEGEAFEFDDDEVPSSSDSIEIHLAVQKILPKPRRRIPAFNARRTSQPVDGAPSRSTSRPADPRSRPPSHPASQQGDSAPSRSTSRPRDPRSRPPSRPTSQPRRPAPSRSNSRPDNSRSRPTSRPTSQSRDNAPSRSNSRQPPQTGSNASSPPPSRSSSGPVGEPAYPKHCEDIKEFFLDDEDIQKRVCKTCL